MPPNAEPPLITVIILNFNCGQWMERCLTSVRQQTLFERLEIIVADNGSTDGSQELAVKIMLPWGKGRVLEHGKNYGYCEGNNRAAAVAAGKYLFFLNNDTWMAPDCLERLVHGLNNAQAHAASPLVLNYEDDSFQSLGAAGFDLFGFTSTRFPHPETREVFMPEGCAYLIERRVFETLGGFDPQMFMYSDELDLSWRLWLAGYSAVAVPAARLHHRGAAAANPKGGSQVVEFRTTDTKRYYANRNGLLVVLKNSQHWLLLLAVLQLAWLAFESLAAFVLIRRWSFIHRAYGLAVADCWRLRPHIFQERRRIRQLRRRSDLWMLRFFRWRLNRLEEWSRVRRYGLPKVSKGGSG